MIVFSLVYIIDGKVVEVVSDSYESENPCIFLKEVLDKYDIVLYGFNDSKYAVVNNPYHFNDIVRDLDLYS